MSQLKKGALLSYLTIIITNITGLFLTPYIVRELGSSEYGLYTLIGAFIGYMSVLDLGINNTVVRFIAKYRANKNKDNESVFLGQVFLIYSLISIIISILGVIIYYNSATIFQDSLTIEEIEKSKIMIALLIFNIAITLPGGTFTGICNGYEKFVFPRTVNIIRYIIRSLLVVFFIYKGGKAISIIVIDTLLNILLILINIYYVKAHLKVKIKFEWLNKSIFKTIFSYSIWIFIFSLISQLFWKSGQMILGITQNTEVVAIFAIGIVLSGYFGAFAGAINSVFLPKATFMIENKSSRKELTNTFIKISRILAILLLFIYGGFILFGREFIILWIGKTYEDAFLISAIIMTAYLLPLIQNFANSIIEATGNFNFKAKVYFSTISLGIILGGYFSKDYSYWSIAIFYNIFWVISQIIMNWYFNFKLNINIPRFFKETFGKNIIVLLLSLISGCFINTLVNNNGWFYFGFKVSLFSIVYLGLTYFIVLNDFEKKLFLKFKK